MSLLLTLILFALMVVAGFSLDKYISGKRFVIGKIILGLLCSVPALTYAGYYLHLVDEPVNLYRLRAIHGSELLPACIGLPMGYFLAFVSRHKSRAIRLSASFIAIGPILILVPFAKVMINPLAVELIIDDWSEDVCLQSVSSTCGPCSAATILRRFGLSGNERSIAIAANTSGTGTEIWYLARVLKNYGLNVAFWETTPNPTILPYPSIAGTRLRNADGSGHFITILSHEGDKYIVGDPISGRRTASLSDLNKHFYFTGFFLVIDKKS